MVVAAAAASTPDVMPLVCVSLSLSCHSRVHVFVKGQSDQRGDKAAVKLDFRDGGKEEFLEQLRHVLQRKEWDRAPSSSSGPGGRGQVRGYH